MDENSPIFQNNPRLYYQYLTGVQRVPPMQAIQMLQQRYGPPKSNQQIAQEQAKQSQMGQIAQGIGMLGGQYVGSKIPGLFGGGGAASGTGTTAAGTGATTTGAGTAVTGGSGAGGAGAGGAGAAGTGSFGAVAVPAAAAAAIAAGVYGGYKTAEKISDMPQSSARLRAGVGGGAASGAAIGGGIGTFIMPGIGTALGAGAGAVIGAQMGLWGHWTGSGKGKAQWERDNIRRVLKQSNILDDKFQGTLADGTKYDFGKDGSTLKWSNVKKIAEENPDAWKAAVPLSDALATAYGFVGQKASDVSAWYAKAGISNAANDPTKAKENIRHFAKQQGITFDMIKQKLDQAKTDNRISDSQYNYYLSAGQDLVGGPPTAPAAKIARPGKGKVARVSEGLYRTDTGRLQAASSMRQALERAYGER